VDLDIIEKQKELNRLRDLILATIDYTINSYNKYTTEHPDPKFVEHMNSVIIHFNNMKIQTEELYRKGSLSKLNQRLRYLVEGIRESQDLNFTTYIKNATGYDFDIFDAFNKRIEKIILKNKIMSDNQCREVESMVDFLCHQNPVDEKQIEILNNLISNYELKLEKKRRS
jgi:hypothetical protein